MPVPVLSKTHLTHIIPYEEDAGIISLYSWGNWEKDMLNILTKDYISRK